MKQFRRLTLNALSMLGRWKNVFLFALACGVPLCVHSNEVPVDASALLQLVKSNLNTAPNVHSWTNDRACTWLVVNEFMTNWSQMLNRAPNETNLVAQSLHEIIQFYFSNRKDFANQNLEKLFNPPFPISEFVERSDTSTSRFARSDFEIRLAYFRLLSNLDIASAMANDPQMKIQTFVRTYLNDTGKPYISKVMTHADLETILDCMEKLPDFSTNYCKELAAQHEANFPGVGLFAKDRLPYDRGDCYVSLLSPLAGPDYFATSSFFKTMLKRRPDLFRTRMDALHQWMEVKLKDANVQLQSIDTWSEEKQGATNQCSAALQELVGMLESCRGLSLANAVELPTNTISKTQIKYVQQINRYLCEPEVRFLIDDDVVHTPIASKPSESFCRAVLSLKKPLAILISYRERHPDVALDKELASLAKRVIDMKVLVSN